MPLIATENRVMAALFAACVILASLYFREVDLGLKFVWFFFFLVSVPAMVLSVVVLRSKKRAAAGDRELEVYDQELSV